MMVYRPARTRPGRIASAEIVCAWSNVSIGPGVCAESGASPISESDPATRAFADAYRTAFDREPDAFALGQYDGVQMLLAAVRAGAKSAADIRAYLASRRYRGLAMTYASDGKGNMAHSAVILCYSGDSRVPVIVKRYENLTGIL